MAQRIEEFDVVCAPGIPPGTPGLQGFIFTQGTVVGLDIAIPYGHHGLAGIQIWFANKQLVPITPGDWVTGNGRTQHYTMKGYPSGQTWQASFYNLDVLQHTFHCHFMIDELTNDSDFPPVILLPYPLDEQASLVGEA